MYIENYDFKEWMQKLFDKLDELCKDVRILRNADKVLSEDDNLLDNQDLCLLFKVSIRTLQRLRSKNELPYMLISGKVYYRASDVRKFIKERFNAVMLRNFENSLGKEVRQIGRSSGYHLLRLSLFYGFPNLSASFFNCLACSSNSLARSNASACLRLRYSKSVTVSVRCRIKLLSRFRLKFISSKSKLLPSAFPFIRR